MLRRYPQDGPAILAPEASGRARFAITPQPRQSTKTAWNRKVKLAFRGRFRHIFRVAKEAEMTDEQINHMVRRFLGWRLPENFNPDAGISFKATFNEHTPWPMKHEPMGTNLFDYTQAEAMVRFIAEGMPG